MNHQPDIDKIHSYAKDPPKAKYQLLINKHENADLKHYHDPKAFVEYSNDVLNVYKNINEYNAGRKRKVLIVFDDMIAQARLNRFQGGGAMDSTKRYCRPP